MVNLAKDLQIEFARVSGFSKRNLRRMNLFYETYKENKKLALMVFEISWSNNLVVLEKCKNFLQAEFYIKKCMFIGWSKYDLQRNISEKLFKNSLLAQNNFDKL